MAVTGWKAPGTAATVDRDGKPVWGSPDNAKTDDDVAAVSIPALKSYTDWLRLTNFGFTTGDIPDGSTIDGIEVQYRHAASLANKVWDDTLYLRKTSGQVGDDYAKEKTYWDTEKETFTYGGAADTWNAGLVDSDIAGNADFGIDISVYNNDSSEQRTAFIFFCQIRIYYTPPAGETYDEKGRLQVILGVQAKSDIATRKETAKLQVALVSQGKVETAAWFEIGRTQIVLAAQARSDAATLLDAREQIILGTQGRIDIRLLPELGKEQVIAAVQGSVDSTVLSEVSKEQVIAAISGKTDTSIWNELSKLQEVLGLHGSLDKATFSEQLLQIILAAQGRTDVYIPVGVIDETGRLQIILAPQGRSDVATFSELDKEQILLITQGKVVGFRFLELAKEQIALAVTGESDAHILSELGRLQVVLALHGSLDQALFSEQLLQIILVEQGGDAVYPYVILYDETGRIQIILITVGSEIIQIVSHIAKPPAIHDLGKTKPHYTLGRPQVDYTMGKAKLGVHNLGRKVE